MASLSSFGALLKPLMDHAQKFAAKQKGAKKKGVDVKAKVKVKLSTKAK